MKMVIFFNDTATTEIYTLSLHDALPIFRFSDHVLARIDVDGHLRAVEARIVMDLGADRVRGVERMRPRGSRSEEHTSELQSRQYLVCRLLLEKKNIQYLSS